MDFRYIAAFLLIATVAYADCVGYTESFDVRVLDAKYRALPNANVTVTYDRGASFGEQYFTTQPQATNSNGIAHFVIYNQGTLTRGIDCKIIANASMEGTSASTTVTVKEHGDPVDVVLKTLYPVRFYVRDQLGRPLENASVAIKNRTMHTDANGEVSFYLQAGTYRYLASYLDAKQESSFEVENDTEYEVKLAFYKVVFDVSDDTGAPLAASVTMFNRTFEAQDGHFEFDKVFGEEVPYSVTARGIVSDGTVIPASNQPVVVVYDIHAPTFGAIKPEVFNDKQRLQISVSDLGKLASGLDLQSMKVSYKMEPADENVPWNDAVVFTAGRNQFTAEFAQLPPNRIVDFKAEIKDKAGNKAEIDGKFTTLVLVQPKNESNGTKNQTNTQPTTQEQQGIPLSYIIGGAIVALLAVSLVFRLKTKTS